MKRFLNFALLNSIILLILLFPAYAQVEWAGIGAVQPASAEALFHSGGYTEIRFDFSGVFSKTDLQGQKLFSIDGEIFGDAPVFSKLAAIPAYKQVRVEIVETTFKEIDFPGAVPESGDLVEIGEPAVMRDLRLIPVNVYPLRPSGKAGKALLMTSALVRLHYEGYSDLNNKEFHGATSDAFRALYESQVVNYNLLDGGFTPFGRGTYLIIIPNSYTNSTYFDQFVSWKKMKGYNVLIHELTSTPPQWTDVKLIIQNYYDTVDPLIEYVLLVGDENGGNITIPSERVLNPETSEYDVADHSYTLLDGSSDYFPEVIIGRVSVSTITEANVIFNKILKYEKTPYIGTNNWHKKILSIGGNYNDSGPAPITPCQTAIWIAQYFLDYGFIQADTILYWGPWSPGGTATDIQNLINQGRAYVSYRGWGNSLGWMFPYFTTSHINSLTNGFMTPVVTSFVCGTGDFGNDQNNPCFGEKFLRFNNLPSGGGAVAFYGPSDLHTSTNHNNAVSSGFFEGMWEGDMVKLGQAAYYSKLTMWEGFPNDRNLGDWVWFYFHVYNVLGDPEMDMWQSTPLAMDIDAPAALPSGAASIPLIIQEAGNSLADAYVTVLLNDTLIAADYSESNGHINLCFDPVISGDLIVTATKFGYIPEILTIPVQSGAFVGYYDDILTNESHPDGSLNPGETATLRVTVKNYGSAAVSYVNALLSVGSFPYLNITPAFLALGPLAAGATANADFNLVLDPSAPANAAIEFTLETHTSSAIYSNKFELVVDGCSLQIEDVSQYNLDPGQNENITITLTNTGDFTASNVSGTLYSFDNSITIVNGSASFGNIAGGANVSNSTPFVVQAAAGAYEGRMVQMRLDLTPEIGAFQTLTFDLVVGYPDSTDPGGPDPYGYFVYDDGDTGYPYAPNYNWIELDPNYGGAAGATRLYLTDDSSTYVPLPFDFVFYGETYDHIMICSNGWVSFDSTWMADFRNWDMPSPLGPPTMINAFWDDLKDTTDGVLDIYYKSDPSGKFIIEWSRVLNRYIQAAERLETFQLILYDPAVQSGITGDGDILVQIHEINDVDLDNNFCTVGLENWDHQIGLEYVFSKNYEEHPTSKILHDEMAILFTTNPPDIYLEVENPPAAIPVKFALRQNYPNPFNNTTRLYYEIASAGQTGIQVFDLNGRLINNLFTGYRSPGVYEAVWRGDDLNGVSAASGVYFIRLQSGEHSSIIKSILLK